LVWNATFPSVFVAYDDSTCTAPGRTNSVNGAIV
jgi:hypothetical protein